MPHGPSTNSPPPGLPAPQRLLVIDDQRLDRAITTHAASRMGFVATAAASIAETQDLLEQGARFDIVVLDLLLGNEDGLEALPLLSRIQPGRGRCARLRLRWTHTGRQPAPGLQPRAPRGGGAAQADPAHRACSACCGRSPARRSVNRIPACCIPPERLRVAIADGQIRPWFQPKMSLTSGAVVGTEALARWVQPGGQSIAPGVVHPGGGAEWPDRRADRYDARPVAGGLRTLAAATAGLLGRGQPLAAAAGRSRPERTASNSGCSSMACLPARWCWKSRKTRAFPTRPARRKSSPGCASAGSTCRSTISAPAIPACLSLVRMPFNEMKIDQAFVREAVDSRDSRKVVRAAASLGRELGLKVVAEGVETETMAHLVEDAGCQVGQGWLYGRAVPPDEFEKQLAAIARSGGGDLNRRDAAPDRPCDLSDHRPALAGPMGIPRPDASRRSGGSRTDVPQSGACIRGEYPPQRRGDRHHHPRAPGGPGAGPGPFRPCRMGA